MQLVRSQWYAPEPQKPISIEAAAVVLCDGDRGGFDRSLEDVTKETGELIGRLVEKLHEKGILDNETVLEILGWRFREFESEPEKE